MDYKNNRYLETYREHYRVEAASLAPAACERLLLGLVHVQELFNRAVEDLAGLLGQALRVPSSHTKLKSSRAPTAPAPTAPPAERATTQRSRLLSQAFVPFTAIAARSEPSIADDKTLREREKCFDCRQFHQSACSHGNQAADVMTQGCERLRRDRSAFQTPHAIYDEKDFEI